MGEQKQKFPMRRAAGKAAVIIGTSLFPASAAASIAHYPDRSAEAIAFDTEDVPADKLAPSMLLGGMFLTAAGCKLLKVGPLYPGIEQAPAAAAPPAEKTVTDEPMADVIPLRPAQEPAVQPPGKTISA